MPIIRCVVIIKFFKIKIISQSLRTGWAMNIKYSVRPLKDEVVTESIFDTYNLIEALKNKQKIESFAQK